MEKQDLHGARVDPSLKRLAYSRMDLSLCSATQSTSQGNMGDSEPPDILCESCAYTNLQSCMSIFSRHSRNSRKFFSA